MNLGNPIGQRNQVPSDGLNQGEHGQGAGLSGGHGHATSQNTQSGQSALGTGSAGSTGAGAGGIPHGTPIADKFTHQGQGQNSVSGAYAGGGTDDALTGQSNAHITGQGVGILGTNLPTSRTSAASGEGHGHSSSSHGSNIPAGVSGAYAGSGARDALTGESHAQRTGAGVGPLGENLPQGHTAQSAALAGTAGAAAAGAGASAYGTGVGASGGAGGHYTTDQSTAGSGLSGLSSTSGPTPGVSQGGLASGTGAAGSGPLDAQRAGAKAHAGGEDVKSKLGLGAGAGAGAAGVGAGAAAGAAAGGAGHYGTATTDSSRGAPVADPKELDTGGRHGLVFQESTGKYVHRHEVDEKK